MDYKLYKIKNRKKVKPYSPVKTEREKEEKNKIENDLDYIEKVARKNTRW